MIKAIIFDFDGTLVLNTEFIEEHLLRVIQRYPTERKLESVEIDEWKKKINELTDKNTGFTEMFDILFKEDSEKFLEDYRSDSQEYLYKPVEGALEFINSLKKKGTKLYVLSNRTKILPMRAIQAGFNPEDFEIYSAPEGHSKPDPISYEKVLERIKEEKYENSEVLFIGNHIDDYKGLPHEWRKRFRAIPHTQPQKQDFLEDESFSVDNLFDNYSNLKESLNNEIDGEINNLS
jgi:HAD superfamily hydrolase (TIGR01549 family)